MRPVSTRLTCICIRFAQAGTGRGQLTAPLAAPTHAPVQPRTKPRHAAGIQSKPAGYGARPGPHARADVSAPTHPLELRCGRCSPRLVSHAWTARDDRAVDRRMILMCSGSSAAATSGSKRGLPCSARKRAHPSLAFTASTAQPSRVLEHAGSLGSSTPARAARTRCVAPIAPRMPPGHAPCPCGLSRDRRIASPGTLAHGTV